MTPNLQSQISFPSRKVGTRRKADCYTSEYSSPRKQARKDINEQENVENSPRRSTRSSGNCPTPKRSTRQNPDLSVATPTKASPQKTPLSSPQKVVISSPVSPLKLRNIKSFGLQQEPVAPPSPKKLASPQKVKSPSKLTLVQPNVSTFAKARQALHTSAPSTIICREQELKKIQDFLQPLVEKKKSGSMYISGRPGTGKTACVTYILSSNMITGKFKYIHINCMLLSSPGMIYNHIAQQLDSKWSTNERDALTFVEQKLTENGPMIILVLDEIDHMSTRDQTVLYSLFELPALKNSRLILIGLANALDLTDRSLVRLQSRVNFKPVLLNFPPYSKQDIATILSQRIKDAVDVDVSQVVAPSALQYLGGKISASSGDLRKAIDVCRRAVELAETASKKQLVLGVSNKNSDSPVIPSAPRTPVSIPMLCKMMASVEGNRFCATDNDDSEDTPLQQKLMIASLLVLVKHGKSKQVTLGQLHQSYSKVCKKFNVTPLDFDEFSHTISLIESRGIVTLKRKPNLRLTPISLRLDEREVESTLKDKTMLSSILAQGSQFA